MFLMHLQQSQDLRNWIYLETDLHHGKDLKLCTTYKSSTFHLTKLLNSQPFFLQLNLVQNSIPFKINQVFKLSQVSYFQEELFIHQKDLLEMLSLLIIQNKSYCSYKVKIYRSLYHFYEQSYWDLTQSCCRQPISL